MDSNQPFLSLWYVRVLLVVALIGVIAALSAYAKLALREAEYSNYGPTTINVRGEGEILAKPDIGQFSFAVRAEGVDATTAQNESAEAINAIVEYLNESGVEEKDIKTTSYNLNPRYRYEPQICPINSFCEREQIVDGFEVSQYVEVKVRDLEAAGSLISGVGERGATNISSLQFTIDDESALKAEAREEAIKDAKQKAKELAKALDVRLVRMISYYEEEGYYPMYGYGGDMMMETAVAKNISPSMPTGENTISSTVNLTFEIR